MTIQTLKKFLLSAQSHKNRLVAMHIQSDSIQASKPSIGSNPEGESDVDTQNRVQTPRMFRVLLLNDDFTPMDFVVLCLQRFFGKNAQESHQIMLDVHKKGSGVAGVFSLEIAEMKVMQVSQFARLNEHPLKCQMEPD